MPKSKHEAPGRVRATYEFVKPTVSVQRAEALSRP
jgi:hypothetical protein